MEIVQEQQLQLKMKFLSGCNMKTIVFRGDKNLVVGIVPGGGRLSKACVDDGILVK